MTFATKLAILSASLALFSYALALHVVALW